LTTPLFSLISKLNRSRDIRPPWEPR
jgi:hypothetical protein